MMPFILFGWTTSYYNLPKIKEAFSSFSLINL